MKKSKVFFNLLLLIFVGTTVYSSRGDLINLYNKGNTLLQEKIAGVTRGGNIKMPDFIEKNYTTSINKKEISPGPLISSEEDTNDETSADSYDTLLSSIGVLSYTNEERKKAGLQPLTINTKLTSSASYKTSDMFAKQYFEHVSPNGEAVSDVAKKFGYQYILVGENLALGNFSSNKKLVDAWMASPGHRANILNENYTEIGISVQKSTYEGKIVWISVQHFGLPSSYCPEVDLKNKMAVEGGESELESMLLTLQEKKIEIEEMEPTNPKYKVEVDEYNKLVSAYNELVADVKSNIKTYNEEVADFNDCINDLTS